MLPLRVEVAAEPCRSYVQFGGCDWRQLENYVLFISEDTCLGLNALTTTGYGWGDNFARSSEMPPPPAQTELMPGPGTTVCCSHGSRQAER
eukprot:scaffold40580_cov39-Prasinocladus_malaysianus.AAC.1